MTRAWDATSWGVLMLYLWPVAVIGYDVALMASGRETISSRTLAMSRQAPVLAGLLFGMVGFLMAHLFFPQTARRDSKREDES